MQQQALSFSRPIREPQIDPRFQIQLSLERVNGSDISQESMLTRLIADGLVTYLSHFGRIYWWKFCLLLPALNQPCVHNLVHPPESCPDASSYRRTIGPSPRLSSKHRTVNVTLDRTELAPGGETGFRSLGTRIHVGLKKLDFHYSEGP